MQSAPSLVAERATRSFRLGVRFIRRYLLSPCDRTVKVRFTRSRASFRELSAFPY